MRKGVLREMGIEKSEKSQELCGPWLKKTAERHGLRALESGAVRRLEYPARYVRGTWAGRSSNSSTEPDAADYE